ncbi:hypothetical protein GCM10028809_66500 [Spirosoma gilvum]
MTVALVMVIGDLLTGIQMIVTRTIVIRQVDNAMAIANRTRRVDNVMAIANRIRRVDNVMETVSRIRLVGNAMETGHKLKIRTLTVTSPMLIAEEPDRVRVKLRIPITAIKVAELVDVIPTIAVVTETSGVIVEAMTGIIIAVKHLRRPMFGKPFSRPMPECRAIRLIGEPIADVTAGISVKKIVVC